MAAEKGGKRKNGGTLDSYRRKRDFARTPEPSGEAARRSPSGRLFVVQKHAARQLHYDLRLELDGVLLSWAVPKGPSLDPARKPLAVHVEDHPLEYADFEGIIPEGEYGGGTVMVWDEGEWEPIEDAVAGLERGDLKFRLHGRKLRGAWALVRMTGDRAGDGRNWLLIKKKDDAARPLRDYNVQAEAPRSVLSGRTMGEIAEDPGAVWTGGRAQPLAGADRAPPRRREADAAAGGPDAAALSRARAAPLPAAVRPQLATPAAAAPDGDGWLHEIKLDGYRLLARIDGDDVRLLTRNGHDWTDRFDEIARSLRRLPLATAVLDGEVVVLDAEGKSDFQALQNAFRGYGPRRFTWYVFDVPYAEGHDLSDTPLLERKAYLAEVLRAAPLAAPAVQYGDHIVGAGPAVFEQARKAGLEGIISKRVDARYVPRRGDGWLKVKATRRQEFVVGGVTPPSGSRTGFGALLLGVHDDAGRLVYCGRVGTGFDEPTLAELAARLGGLRRDEPPFANPEADPEARLVAWVEPETVVEVEFTAWTGEGLVRHAVFRGLRPDVDPSDVTREPDAAATSRPPRATGPRRVVTGTAPDRVVRAPRSPDDATVAGVRISNPQRTVYPDDGVTKGQVAEYYAQVAGWILPHVAGRPLSLVRCPLGLAGDAFYQRHLGEGFPAAIRGIAIEGEDEPGLVVDDVAGLLALVQMGVLEIHVWNCRADRLDRPDRMVIDLDPGPGIEWEHVVESARFLREYLDDLGLAGFVKTSGGKGMHVVVPLVRRAGWDEVKAFARAIAEDVTRIAPRNFVATMAKSLRTNRIYLDYLRNAWSATSVAPYSTRARDGACVSTPLAWDELPSVTGPRDFTVATVPGRLAGLPADPWAGLAAARRSITAAMRRKVGMR